jgi:hypothetical protein
VNAASRSVTGPDAKAASKSGAQRKTRWKRPFKEEVHVGAEKGASERTMRFLALFHTTRTFFSASSITPESYKPSIGQRKSLPGPHGQTGIVEEPKHKRTCFNVALNIQEIRPCP